MNFELSALSLELDFMVIQIPIEDWLDLHTFSPREIPSLLEDYLFECRKKGFRRSESSTEKEKEFR